MKILAINTADTIMEIDAEEFSLSMFKFPSLKKVDPELGIDGFYNEKDSYHWEFEQKAGMDVLTVYEFWEGEWIKMYYIGPLGSFKAE